MLELMSMNNFTANTRIFDKYLSKHYPEKDSFLKHEGRSEEFNRKNTQIIVNELPIDILFIGDSITEGWETSCYFSKYGRIINRGISGEKLSELVLRFYKDCVELKPKLCVFCSGINDTYNLYKKMASGEEITPQDKSDFLFEYKNNLLKIVNISKENNIRIWLGSVLPLGTSDFRSQLIISMNEVIKSICNDYGLVYVDYHTKMVKDDGVTMQDFTFGDMLHPHVIGYNVMFKVLNELLEKEF